MKPDDGGQAFPHFYVWDRERREQISVDNGMTLRDWFAGRALAGMLSDPTVGNPDDREDSVVDAELASCAYAMADAMLAERSKDKV